MATLLHAVNAVAEIIYMSKKAGKLIAPKYETQIKLAEIAKLVRSDSDALIMGDPSAFYDCKDERWVLIWSSYPKQDAPDSGAEPVTASLFVAVSHTIDPLEDWTVYALEARPLLAPGYRFCDAGGKSFSALAPQVIDVGMPRQRAPPRAASPKTQMWPHPVLCAQLPRPLPDTAPTYLHCRHLHFAAPPQTSYSDDGIFISIGASCASAAMGAGTAPPTGIMSTLYAYSKVIIESSTASSIISPSAAQLHRLASGPASWQRLLSKPCVQPTCSCRSSLALTQTSHLIHASCSSRPCRRVCLSVSARILPSQAALYDVDDPDTQIFAATYMGAMSWKSSIAYKEQALIRDDYRCG